jgi:hypothetical protein
MALRHYEKHGIFLFPSISNTRAIQCRVSRRYNPNQRFHPTTSNTPYNDARNSYLRPFPTVLTITWRKESGHNKHTHHFFLPFVLPFETGAGLDAVDMTLDALEEGAAEVALLPAPDLMLSSALFW